MFPPVVDGGCSRKTMVSESSPVDLVVALLVSNHWQSLPVSSSHRSIDNKIVPTVHTLSFPLSCQCNSLTT